MENGNIRDYIRRNLGADRVRLLSEVASGADKKNWFYINSLC